MHRSRDDCRATKAKFKLMMNVGEEGRFIINKWRWKEVEKLVETRLGGYGPARYIYGTLYDFNEETQARRSEVEHQETHLNDVCIIFT
mmetsp:Transcript_3186/g.8981  ORF Transcript_3186/g.8981 Transcript_3186/m.8981 type:complete len:88 (+) Transcript_3186:1530-1793(+)